AGERRFPPRCRCARDLCERRLSKSLQQARDVSLAMDIRSLTIEGQRLRIGVRAGAPRLAPLIVFNGIGASLELARPFVSALPEREVVAFDVPGSGGSPAALLPYRFPGLARLAQRLLIELGYNGAVDALGVSWGGALAQTFAFHFPTHCRKLVLASTSAGALMVPGRPSVLAKLVSPRRYVDPDFLHAFGGEIYGGAFRSDPDLLRRHAQALWAPSNRGYLYQLIAAAGWTSLPSLAAAAAAAHACHARLGRSDCAAHQRQDLVRAHSARRAAHGRRRPHVPGVEGARRRAGRSPLSGRGTIGSPRTRGAGNEHV